MGWTRSARRAWTSAAPSTGTRAVVTASSSPVSPDERPAATAFARVALVVAAAAGREPRRARCPAAAGATDCATDRATTTDAIVARVALLGCRGRRLRLVKKSGFVKNRPSPRPQPFDARVARARLRSPPRHNPSLHGSKETRGREEGRARRRGEEAQARGRSPVRSNLHQTDAHSRGGRRAHAKVRHDAAPGRVLRHPQDGPEPPGDRPSRQGQGARGGNGIGRPDAGELPDVVHHAGVRVASLARR